MRRWLLILIALLFYSNSYPFFVTSWFVAPSFLIVGAITMMWFILLPKRSASNYKIDKSFTTCSVIMFVFFLLRGLFLQEVYGISNAVQIILGWLGVVFVMRTFTIEETVKFLNRFILVVIILSVIGVLLYALGIQKEMASMVYNSSKNGDEYIKNFMFFNTKVADWTDYILVRSAGCFDEPGSFAFVIALLLIINCLYYTSNNLNKWLIWGGCITLSAAHFVISATYMLFSKFQFKTLFLIGILSGAVMVAYIALPEDGVGGFVRKYTFDRFESISEGTDGSRKFDKSKLAAKENVIMGESDETLRKKYPDATAETLYFEIARYGIVGLPFYFLYCIVGMWKIRKKPHHKMIYLILFLLLFQRPDYIFPFYILLLYIAFFSNSNNEMMLSYGK